MRTKKAYLLLVRNVWKVCDTKAKLKKAMIWYDAGEALGLTVEYGLGYELDYFESFIRSIRQDCLPRLLLEIQAHMEHAYINPRFEGIVSEVLSNAEECT